MHLDRIVIVVEQRFRKDGLYPGWELRHTEGPLQCTGIVDNIDVFYYGDYPSNCDEALINYCLQTKPQAVLLSLQNVAVREEGAPTPNGVGKITHQLGIPTVAIWFDIHSDDIAEILERYLHSVTLNMILAADASSHKPLPLEGTNYIYASATFDDRLFDIPERVRDIPVGILGTLFHHRRQWIAELIKHDIPVYTAGGIPVQDDKTTPVWLPYEEYLALTSRLKIVLDFAEFNIRTAIFSPNKERLREALDWLAYRLKTYSSALVKNPAKSKRIIPALKNTASELLLKKPIHQVRARVWEALWCRTLLLEEDNPVVSLYFEPYVDYVPFTSLKDLVDKIRYYLENDEERDRIRLQGRATVEKYYNARIHWENLFEAIGIPSGGENYHHPGEIWNKAYFDNWYLSHPDTHYD